MLTPDDVRNVVFSGAWRKERGYDEAQVDRFLARVEATLRGKRMVTARDVLTARFSPRKKGRRAYKKVQVDRFLDRVALTLMKLEVRDEDEVPRKHRLRSGGEANAFGTPRRRRAREAAEQPVPGQPAVEQPAAQSAAEQPAPETPPAPVGPRRPERPDPEAARRQQPQPPQASPPAEQPPVPTAAPPTVQTPAPVAAAIPQTVQTPVPAAVPPTAQTPVPAAPPAPVPQTPVPPPSAQTTAPQSAAAPQRTESSAPSPSSQNGRATASASEMVRDPARFGVLEPAKSRSTALDKAEVDAFMDRVQATLRGADTVSPKDVLNAQFNPPRPGMPGYDKEGVLAFLKAVSASIHNITARNLRPVDPAEVQRNGQGNGSNPRPTVDQQPTMTIPTVQPDDPAPAGAFPARLSGNLQTGQSASQRG